MAVLGLGQGISLSPLTVAGVAGVPARDAGAASGVVNAAHQLGGSMGLALLVVVFARSGGLAEDPRADLAERVSACLAVGSGLLWAALLVAIFCIARRAPQSPAATAGTSSRLDRPSIALPLPSGPQRRSRQKPR